MLMLLNPPNPPNRVSNKDVMGGYGQIYDRNCRIKMPVIDILTTAAVAEKKGIEVSVVDCPIEGISAEGVLSILSNKRPKILALRTSTPTFNWDLKIAEAIKRKYPAIDIVFFGPHASLFASKIIKNECVDIVAVGEFELTLADLAIKGKENTKGIWFKQGDMLFESSESGLVTNLEELPFPAWHLVPYHKYFLGEFARFKTPSLTMLTSRGCPFNCGYCPYPISQGNKWRFQSPKRVVDEIEYLVNQLGTKFILMRDAEFCLDGKRVEDICKGIKERNINVNWRCETRVDTLDTALIEKMADAGCTGINFGIESIDSDVLRNSGRKSYRLDDIKQIVNVCKDSGIDTYCFFIIGLPGDTKEKVMGTIKFAIELDPTMIQFTVATPYYGTPIREWAVKHGFLKEESGDNLSGWDVVMRNEYMNERQITTIQLYANYLCNMRWENIKSRVLENGKIQWVKEAVKILLFF